MDTRGAAPPARALAEYEVLLPRAPESRVEDSGSSPEPSKKRGIQPCHPGIRPCGYPGPRPQRTALYRSGSRIFSNENSGMTNTECFRFAPDSPIRPRPTIYVLPNPHPELVEGDWAAQHPIFGLGTGAVATRPALRQDQVMACPASFPPFPPDTSLTSLS